MERTLLERLVLRANRLVAPLVRRGIPMGSRHAPMALLTVPGRKSGLPRTAPVALAASTEGWTLISAYGISDWSRNLEAAGSATLTMGGTTTRVDTERLGPDAAAPILKKSVADAPGLVRWMTAGYFEATPDSPLGDWERESERHPVFRLIPSTTPAPTT